MEHLAGVVAGRKPPRRRPHDLPPARRRSCSCAPTAPTSARSSRVRNRPGRPTGARSPSSRARARPPSATSRSSTSRRAPSARSRAAPRTTRSPGVVARRRHDRVLPQRADLADGRRRQRAAAAVARGAPDRRGLVAGRQPDRVPARVGRVRGALFDGGGERQVSPRNVFASGPAWSPDGRRIPFDVQGELRAAGADGGDARRLTYDAGPDHQRGFRPRSPGSRASSRSPGRAPTPATVRPADLAVDVSVGAQEVALGGTVHVVATVRNLGPNPATLSAVGLGASDNGSIVRTAGELAVRARHRRLLRVVRRLPAARALPRWLIVVEAMVRETSRASLASSPCSRPTAIRGRGRGERPRRGPAPRRGLHASEGTPGDDVLSARRDAMLARGLEGSDTILARGGADRVYAGAGDDVVRGEGGNDVVDGGRGDDRIEGGPGSGICRGGDGADRAYGGAGNDRVRGGIPDGRSARVSPDITERDSLHGGPGADVVEGGVGRDVLRGDAGPDLLLARDRYYRDIVVCGLGATVSRVTAPTGRSAASASSGAASAVFTGIVRELRRVAALDGGDDGVRLEVEAPLDVGRRRGRRLGRARRRLPHWSPCWLMRMAFDVLADAARMALGGLAASAAVSVEPAPRVGEAARRALRPGARRRRRPRALGRAGGRLASGCGSTRRRPCSACASRRARSPSRASTSPARPGRLRGRAVPHARRDDARRLGRGRRQPRGGRAREVRRAPPRDPCDLSRSTG